MLGNLKPSIYESIMTSKYYCYRAVNVKAFLKHRQVKEDV
jgi:hypothetical protein